MCGPTNEKPYVSRYKTVLFNKNKEIKSLGVKIRLRQQTRQALRLPIYVCPLPPITAYARVPRMQ